jgi:hypothetical protein
MIPKSCSQRIIELRETLLIPLKSNAWTFIAPGCDQLTILCQNQEPYDLEIKGNGKITFYKDCTGYGSQVLITSFTEGNVNNTQKDVIPPLTLTMECCESESNKLILDAMLMAAPIKKCTYPH